MSTLRQGSGCAKGKVRVERRKERSVRKRDADRKTLLEEREREREREREFLKLNLGSCGLK